MTLAHAEYALKKLGIIGLIILLPAKTVSAQSSGPGEALYFNGVNSYVYIQHTTDLNPYPMTVMAWVKTSQASGGGGIVDKYASGSFSGWTLNFFNGEANGGYFYSEGHYVSGGGSGPIADGIWHHLAFTVDQSGGKLYLDGILKNATGWVGTPLATTSRQPINLGFYPGSGPAFFSGLIDEISVWNIALSQAQIQNYMHQSLSGNDPLLVLYLRLDDGPGGVVYDSTAHGHNGILVDAPAWVTSDAPISAVVSDISSQPLGRIVEAGTSVSFSVTTTTTPATYQWRFNSEQITSATGSTYSLTNVTSTNAGIYDVVVSNANGAKVSAPAELSIISLPQILLQPVGEVANEGSDVSFTPQTLGGRPFTNNWYRDGNLVSTSLDSTLNLKHLKPSDAGAYQLVVSNSFGAVTSTPAILKVYSGPITNGLVAHLAFENNLIDASGYNNTGRYLHNGIAGDLNPTFSSGEIGQAFQYSTYSDGSKFNYATFDYPPDLQLSSNDFSISMWVNYSNQGGDLPFLSNKDWARSHNPGWAISTQSAGTFRINFTGMNEGMDMFTTALTPVVRDGTWHNIAVSVLRVSPPQSAFVYAYVDGTLVNKSPISLAGTIDTLGLPFSYASPRTTVQTNWAINIGQDGTGVYYDGSSYNIGAKIDDIGIWRRALTPQEAKSISDSGRAAQDLTQAEEYSSLRFSISGTNLILNWSGSPTVKLQTRSSLQPYAWTDVNGSLGQSSASIPLTTTSAFFRLAR